MAAWVADEAVAPDKLEVVGQVLGFPPDMPSYGPFLMGLEIGGGPVPRRLGYEQYDLQDWSDRAKHSNGRPVQYTLGDARALPYADETFAHVFSSNLLEHFKPTETTAVLTEWARVLRPHGALELIVPDAIGILRDFFDDKVSWPDTAERVLGSRDYRGNDHFSCFTRSEFPQVIAQVPSLELISLLSSHSGGGIHAVAVKLP